MKEIRYRLLYLLLHFSLLHWWPSEWMWTRCLWFGWTRWSSERRAKLRPQGGNITWMDALPKWFIKGLIMLILICEIVISNARQAWNVSQSLVIFKDIAIGGWQSSRIHGIHDILSLISVEIAGEQFTPFTTQWWNISRSGFGEV